MQFLESLTDRTPLFAADAATAMVARAFADRPGSPAFPVTDSAGIVIGLVERASVTRAIADGQVGCSIADLVQRRGPVLDAALSARDAIGLLLAHPDQHETFVVTDGRQCLGVCSLRVLAQALLVTETPGGRPDEFDQAVIDEFQRLYQAVAGEFRAHAEGAPQLEAAPVFIDCVVENIHVAGDHLIVVGRGARIEHTSAATPLLYHKGAFPKLHPPE
jgi:hypothetical protein